MNCSFFEDDQQEAHTSSRNDENVHEEVEWNNEVTNSRDLRLRDLSEISRGEGGGGGNRGRVTTF